MNKYECTVTKQRAIRNRKKISQVSVCKTIKVSNKQAEKSKIKQNLIQ